MLNMWYGPSVATMSSRLGDLPFIMGQLMVFRREALRDIGGVACARGELVDDMAIGRAVARTGWRNVMAPHPLHIATGGMSYGEFLKLSRRWMLFGRNGLPFEFTKPMWLRGLEWWVAAMALVMALGTHHWLAALAPAAALALFEVSLLVINREFGGARVKLRHWWVPFAIPVVMPAQLAYGLIDKRVEWRGRAYDLDTQARLA
jgi:ceramide glucosyltransferase